MCHYITNELGNQMVAAFLWVQVNSCNFHTKCIKLGSIPQQKHNFSGAITFKCCCIKVTGAINFAWGHHFLCTPAHPRGSATIVLPLISFNFDFSLSHCLSRKHSQSIHGHFISWSKGKQMTLTLVKGQANSLIVRTWQSRLDPCVRRRQHSRLTATLKILF